MQSVLRNRTVSKLLPPLVSYNSILIRHRVVTTVRTNGGNSLDTVLFLNTYCVKWPQCKEIRTLIFDFISIGSLLVIPPLVLTLITTLSKCQL